MILRPGLHGNILECSTQDDFPADPDFRAYHSDGVVAVVHQASQGSFYRDGLYHSRRAVARDAGMLWGACHTIDASSVTAQVTAFIEASEFTAIGADPCMVTVDYADIDEPAALHQLRDFVAQVDRALPSVSCVVRGSTLLRTNLTPPTGGFTNPSMTGYRDFFRKHRVWLTEEKTDNVPWPWNKVFIWGSDIPGVHRFWGSRDELAGRWLA